jgi:hypothetical protein
LVTYRVSSVRWVTRLDLEHKNTHSFVIDIRIRSFFLPVV